MFAEPAGATSYAGLVKAVNESLRETPQIPAPSVRDLRTPQSGAARDAADKRMEKIDPAETIVVVVTGNGLKDVASAMKAAGAARVIEPKLEAVKNVLGKDKVHA